MNWRLYDKSFKKVCDINDSDVKNKKGKRFWVRLYQNIGDVYQTITKTILFWSLWNQHEQTDFALGTKCHLS